MTGRPPLILYGIISAEPPIKAPDNQTATSSRDMTEAPNALAKYDAALIEAAWERARELAKQGEPKLAAVRLAQKSDRT